MSAAAAIAPTLIRCDLNESAYPPPPAVAAVIAAATADAHRYPDAGAASARTAIAEFLDLGENQVTVGPGGTGVAQTMLAAAVRAARAAGRAQPQIVTPTPTFDGYPILARLLGAQLAPSGLDALGRPDIAAIIDAVGPDTAAVVVCSPHNPTGASLAPEAVRMLLHSLPSELPVLLDQAYVEFSAQEADLHEVIAEFPSLVVLRTFSKAYALAGLRVGYAVGSPSAIAPLRADEMPFAVTTLAGAAVPAALAAHADMATRARAVRSERDRLTTELIALGAPVLPSSANFVFLPGADGLALGHALRAAGILGRFYPDGFRLTVGTSAVTSAILAALQRTAQLL